MMITSAHIIELSKIVGAITVIFGAISTIFLFIRMIFKKIDKTEKIYETYESIGPSLTEMKKDLKSVIKRIDKQTEEIEDIKTQMVNNNNLTLNLARDELLKTLREVIDSNGWDSSEQFGIACKMFDAYTSNGGNSEICALMEKAKTYKTYKRNLIDVKKE